MDFDLEVKLAVYRHFAASGARPSATQIARGLDATVASVREAFDRLLTQRVLVLEADGESIRMAPPFSGVPTQHVVTAEGVSYFANCAWDALGIPAALQKRATLRSRCEQSLEPLQLEVSAVGPERSDWLFHCGVPAAHWLDDIVFT
jgi:alkylmercury lyase-like protein